MKAQHIATLAVISLLSTVAISSCSSSPSATTPATNTVASNAAEVKPNPFAAKDKTNPCAAKDKANPCAAKDKANPCAAKAASTSIGEPLAQKLQGKPVVVDVYATWCPACKNIAPTISDLKKEYEGKVEFVVLDVSDKSTTAAAEATAKELGLSKFLAENKTQTGSLTIIDPATGKVLAQYRNNADKAAYTQVLDKALAR
ncbi:TlpA family protein disulfide reductase [Pseudanabaena sp. Chao 1811]|uniref:TlpA family protein disulfide reductase n=1 Tax=Pseudanabaena sp. Chao 1811 TaxID=2963092 RepID=UPI0022F3BFF2|nr:thioredoxin family protein [Pseudanabaena sp. Chao 1811]